MRPSRLSAMALSLVLAVVLILTGVEYWWCGEDEEQTDEWTPRTDAPRVQLLYQKGPGNNYSFQVYRASFPAGIENFTFFVRDEIFFAMYIGPVAIGNYARENGDNEIRGIEAYSTWKMKNHSADDYELFRERAMKVENGTLDCNWDTCNIVFYDNDYNDLLSHGDIFFLRGSQSNHTGKHDIQDGWIFRLSFNFQESSDGYQTVAEWRLT